MFGFGTTMTQERPRPRGAFEEDEGDAFFFDLLEQINKKLLISLRDGRTVIGRLRSVDQFTNLALTEACERIYVGNKYGDIDRGVIIVRGDSLVITGEFDTENEENSPLLKVSEVDILRAQKEQQDETELREQKRINAFKQRGLQYVPPNHNRDPAFRLGEDLFS